jgi:predicted metal-binding membrane protein
MALERAVLLDATMASASDALGGIVLTEAGTWSPLEDACRAQCQTPFLFLMCHGGFPRDAPGCLQLGLRHGAYCVGRFWVRMSLLLVGSVMNVLWIAPLASLVLSQKLISIGRPIARFAGKAFIVAGARLSLRGMS